MAISVGFALFPRQTASAPIKPSGILFTDKLGAKFTYEQFRAYQKWEVAYIVSWSIYSLLIIVFLPFFDRTSKRWRF
jgi:hypothetical protein